MMLSSLYNSARRWLAPRRVFPGDLLVGDALRPDQRPYASALIRASHRSRHIAILGKTGSGKTTLLRHFAEQDLRAGHGFVFLDLHGQTASPLMSAAAEAMPDRLGLTTGRTVLIEPADREFSCGINVLEAIDDHDRHVKVAELVELLRSRWQLETFGARTEELLRNSLLFLIACRLTLVELEPLLTDARFRQFYLRKSSVTEPVRDYFELRFAALSPQMRSVVVEPVINKVTAFTTDPHIRHIVGQQRSTLTFQEIIEHNYRVVVNLDKGRLGAHALTLGSLLLVQLKHALFARRSRRVFTIYCDEIQNLVAFDAGLEDLLAESRKFGVSIASANQYLDQLTPRMRSALLSVSSILCFRLSGPDAQRVAYFAGVPASTSLDLRALPDRHLIQFAPPAEPTLVRVPELPIAKASAVRLRSESMRRFALPRTLVERQIRARRMVPGKELDDWE